MDPDNYVNGCAFEFNDYDSLTVAKQISDRLKMNFHVVIKLCNMNVCLCIKELILTHCLRKPLRRWYLCVQVFQCIFQDAIKISLNTAWMLKTQKTIAKSIEQNVHNSMSKWKI